MRERRIDFEGIEFSIPANEMELPVEVVEAWEDSRVTAFIRGLIGQEAWAAFKARNPKMSDLLRLSKVVGDAYGFESAGESSGSGASLSGTAEPSPQISEPSTASASEKSSTAP